MPIRVLIVDDSNFFRRQITKILETDKDIQVVDVAVNGQEAIEKAVQLKPDVITMDVEMPVMDGITAVRAIMEKSPTAILMFSSLTLEGAKSTLSALEAGAADFLPKKFEDIARDKDEVARVLCERVRNLGQSKGRASFVPPPPAPSVAKKASAPAPASGNKAPAVSPAQRKTGTQLVAIGTSTGGPIALQAVLSSLPANFPLPIVLVQHMPGTFTPAFAQRLDQVCDISVKEAADGDVLRAGHAYLAPGGKQMLIQKHGGEAVVKIEESQAGQTYKPCVDITFDSVLEAFGGKVLAILLTGMGHDGLEGAKKLKNAGAKIWAQDEKTCVVYGMPQAVVQAGITEKILPLQQIGAAITTSV